MKKIGIAAALVLAVMAGSVSAQSEFQARGLLQKKVWFMVSGKVADTASYWSMHLGRYECVVNQDFPGEGSVAVKANFDFNLLSSMYIEGYGYGDRGKIVQRAEYAIGDSASSTIIEVDSIDYVYGWGGKVHMKSGKDMGLVVQVQTNTMVPFGLSIDTWTFNKEMGELKKNKSVEAVSAFSFTKEGAQRAAVAQKAFEASQNTDAK